MWHTNNQCIFSDNVPESLNRRHGKRLVKKVKKSSSKRRLHKTSIHTRWRVPVSLSPISFHGSSKTSTRSITLRHMPFVKRVSSLSPTMQRSSRSLVKSKWNSSTSWKHARYIRQTASQRKSLTCWVALPCSHQSTTRDGIQQVHVPWPNVSGEGGDRSLRKRSPDHGKRTVTDPRRLGRSTGACKQNGKCALFHDRDLFDRLLVRKPEDVEARRAKREERA